MTREKAVAVAQALDAIEMFECLSEGLEATIDQFRADMPDIALFESELMVIIAKEKARRNTVLENL